MADRLDGDIVYKSKIIRFLGRERPMVLELQNNGNILNLIGDIGEASKKKLLGFSAEKSVHSNSDSQGRNEENNTEVAELDVNFLFMKSRTLEKLSSINETMSLDPTHVTRLRGGTIIKVKTLTGKYFNINFETTDTISSIKKRIMEKEGIPPIYQRIIYKGKLLADGKNVKECEIEGGSVLDLVLALRGGIDCEYFKPLADKLIPGIVKVNLPKYTKQLFATGFVICADPCIVYTIGHMIEDEKAVADEIEANISFINGETCKAKVFAFQKFWELLLLVCEPSFPVTCLKFAPSNHPVRNLDSAWAIGHPYQRFWTVTVGCVSKVHIQDAVMANSLQVDPIMYFFDHNLSLYHGASGAPIMNVVGDVIGVACCQLLSRYNSVCIPKLQNEYFGPDKEISQAGFQAMRIQDTEWVPCDIKQAIHIYCIDAAVRAYFREKEYSVADSDDLNSVIRKCWKEHLEKLKKQKTGCQEGMESYLDDVTSGPVSSVLGVEHLTTGFDVTFPGLQHSQPSERQFQQMSQECRSSSADIEVLSTRIGTLEDMCKKMMDEQTEMRQLIRGLSQLYTADHSSGQVPPESTPYMPTDSSSMRSSSHPQLQPNQPEVHGKTCYLLDCDEPLCPRVAEATIRHTDPTGLCRGFRLSRTFYAVEVVSVLPGFDMIHLPFAYDDIQTLLDAVGQEIAWPRLSIELR